MESRYKTWAYLRGGLETGKEIDTLYILQASPHKYCYSWQSFQEALHSSEIISPDKYRAGNHFMWLL